MRPLQYWRNLCTAIGTLVVDLGSDFHDVATWRWMYRLGIGALVIFFGWAVIGMCREGPARPALFVALLSVLPVAALLVPDMVLGGRRATVPRYLLPAHVGLLLAMARVLAVRVTRDPWDRRRWAWCTVVGLVLALQLLSYHAWASSPVWWTKMRQGLDSEVSRSIPTSAELVNRSQFPILVAEVNSYSAGDLLVLSHLLRPDVRLLVARDAPAAVYHGSDQWLWVPSDGLRRRYGAQGFRVDPVLEGSGFWRVSSP